MNAQQNDYQFILVDGSSYLYRAFYALPPLTNSKGEPTGAIYGVINMLKKLMQDYHADYVAVVFDAKGETFRDELFADYKATRAPMPDPLIDQIEPLMAIIDALGFPLLIIDQVEADDVIGTLAVQAAKKGLATLISTGDKDMAQIVDDKIHLINTMSGKLYDRAGVMDKFGIPPEAIIDYLALVGDNVDNIPGIPKVGPKTAVKWLTEYKTLDGVIQNAEKIKGKVGENLRANLQTLELSKKLATIKLDVEMPFTIEALKLKQANKSQLEAWYKKLEFKTWLSELLTPAKHEAGEYQLITTEKQLQDYLARIKKQKLMVIDTETNSLNYMQAELVGISLALKPAEGVYIPLTHDYMGAPKQLSRALVLDLLKPILADEEIKKIGHHIKYDQHILLNYDMQLRGIAFDTMLESYVLNSSASRHDMDTLALKYLGKNTIHYEDVCGKGKKQITFNQVDLKQALDYAAEDADITFQLHETLYPKIAADEKLNFVYEKIELPLVPILTSMEHGGVLIDAKKLAAQSQDLAKLCQQLQDEAFAIAKEEFNLNSPKQLREILFSKLNLPVLSKTPTGQASTAESVLQELALDYPLPNIILRYRSLSKLQSTYAEALPKQINPNTGRVHTSYNQAITATGRLSSTDPNLQNIPIRTEEGRRIRQAFIAPPDHKILAADYSQIELRIMADLSDDPNLKKAFKNGHDIHRATASELLDIPIEKVTSEQRRSAKAVNFGLIYGISAYGLSRQLGIDVKQAQAYMDLYFHRYPNVLAYMEQARVIAHERGYVETIFGRRLYLPEINVSNIPRRKAAERAAINAPMQGTAADIIKLAMIKMYDYIQTSQVDARMIMQVHDELVFEVAESCLDNFKSTVEDIMTHAVELKVPLEVSVGIGDNWDEAH
ncbi:MAG: DNA polymerase I [Pseudomonadota bacterium]